MAPNWMVWAVAIVAIGLLNAAAFVGGSYVLAIIVTRGRFGWPGFVYFVRETLWVALTQSALPAGWLRKERIRALPVAGGGEERPVRPIVLVHGFTQNRTNFMWLSRYLAARGHGPFFGFDYWSFQRIETSARELQAFVDRVVAATGATEVDLVCHSLGGLVARTYVDLLGGHARVRRVVTLGTPHRGIRLALGGWLGRSVYEMQPRHGFIQKLDDAPVPAGVRYVSIYSMHDNIVLPGVVSSLAGRGRDVVVHQQGHFGILFSGAVAAHVHAGLTDADELTGSPGGDASGPPRAA
jgi:triacylglycerol esterase/lipase EstA (alpha/beta hydrolase family)